MSTRRQLLPQFMQSFLVRSAIGSGILLLAIEYILFIPLFEGDEDTFDTVRSPRVLCGIGGEPPFDSPPECEFYERGSVSSDLPVWLPIGDPLFTDEKPFFLSDEFKQDLFWDNSIDFGETGSFRDLQLSRKPLMPPSFNVVVSISGELSAPTPLDNLSTSLLWHHEEGLIVSSKPLEALSRFFDSLKIGVEKPRVQIEDLTGYSSQSQLDQDFYLEDLSLSVDEMKNIGSGKTASKESLKVFDVNKLADLKMEVPQDSDVGRSKFDFESDLMPNVRNKSNAVDSTVANKQENEKIDDLEVTTFPDSDKRKFHPSTDLEIHLNDGDVIPLLPGLVRGQEQGIIRDKADDPVHIPENQSWIALSLLAGYFGWHRRKKR